MSPISREGPIIDRRRPCLYITRTELLPSHIMRRNPRTTSRLHYVGRPFQAASNHRRILPQLHSSISPCTCTARPGEIIEGPITITMPTVQSLIMFMAVPLLRTGTVPHRLHRRIIHITCTIQQLHITIITLRTIKTNACVIYAGTDRLGTKCRRSIICHHLRTITSRL